jgi:hypothetical protein
MATKTRRSKLQLNGSNGKHSHSVQCHQIKQIVINQRTYLLSMGLQGLGLELDKCHVSINSRRRPRVGFCQPLRPFYERSSTRWPELDEKGLGWSD